MAAFRRTLREDGFDYEATRVIAWRGRRYAQLFDVQLQESAQLVPVLDVTDVADLAPGPPHAPANAWVSIGEGPYGIVKTTGSGGHAQLAIMDLPVSVAPAGVREATRLQLERLEASADG